MAAIDDMAFARRLKKIVPWRKVGKALVKSVRGKRVSVASLPRPSSDTTPPRDVAFLCASVTDEHPSALRGAIDLVNATDGIAGWLVDLTAPGIKQQLELFADGVIIGQTETTIFRDDIGLRTVPEMTPGFRFSPSTLLALLESDGGKRPGDIAIRVAGTGKHLRATSANLAHDVYAAAQAHAARAPEAVYLDPLDFSHHLQTRRLLANALLARPFRPQTGTLDGYIEIVSALSSDTVMIVGWLRQPKPIDFSGVIVGARKYPSGFSGITFARPDLQSPGVGFVAFVRTDWRPAPGSPITVYWGASIPYCVRGNATMRVLSPTEAGGWISSLEGKAAARPYGEFQRYLSKLDTWVPAAAGLREAGISHGIDRVFVVPGFGSLAVGWVLSPYKRLSQMALRLGTHVAAGDRRSFSLAPRPDLAAKAELADKIAGAGFHAALRGSVKESDISQPMLRLFFDDGSSYAVPVPRQTVRLCDSAEAIATLTHFFPGLASEPFLEDFADAFADNVRQRARAIMPIVTAPSPRVMVIALPRNPDDRMLVLANIRRSAAHLPADVGLALLTTAQISRGRLLEQFEDLRTATGRPLSLFEVNDPAYAIWSLAPVLAALEATRFWFCSHEAVPTQTGWRAAGACFAESRDGLALFLRAKDSGGGPEPESLCFAWSTEAFGAWEASAPFFLGGFHRDNRLPIVPQSARTDGAIGVVRSTAPPEPVRRADERLYRASCFSAAKAVLNEPFADVS